MKPLPIITFIILLSQFALILNTKGDQIVASDYPAFYSTAQLWNKGQNPYDLKSQCAEQSFRQGYECLPFAHPPLLLPLIGLVTSDDVVSSYWRWVAILSVLTLVAGFGLYLLTQDKMFAAQSVLFAPLLIALSHGQDMPIVLLAVVLCFWSLLKGNDLIAGMVLSLALVKPQLALLIAIPIMIARYRFTLGFVLGSLIAIVWSWLLVGTKGFKGILSITQAMSSGVGYGVARDTMPNVMGILARASIDAQYGLIVTVLGLAAVSYLLKRFGVSLVTLSVVLIVSLFVSPHLHAHDLSLLVIPLYAVYKHVKVSLSAISLMVLLSYGVGLDLPFVLLLMTGLLAFLLSLNQRDRNSIFVANPRMEVVKP